MTNVVWTVGIALSAAVVVALPRPEISAGRVPAYSGGPPDTLIVNPGGSSIHWKAGGLGGLAAREGTLGMGKGMFVIRHQQLTSGTFRVSMRQLDDALQGPELFDVAHNPTAVFSSRGMTRVGPDRWEVTGDLTMRGVTRPITFQADVRWEELGHMIATSTFTIDRREWGIGARTEGFMSDFSPWAIQLYITVDARRKQAATAAR